MERVSDEWLDGILDIQSKEVDLWGWTGKNIANALIELRERRRAEKEQANTNPMADTKDGVEGLGERERAILPLPCTKGVGEWTVKNWMQKFNEEIDEFKAAVFACVSGDIADFIELDSDIDSDDKLCIAEESADVNTVMTSMLERFGIDEKLRQAAQERVNERNQERGRL